ncbi:IS3 family transposase [Streptomyces sp. NBC_00452]|uniref:IS3 family transposase n=1 Tax=Streptomyces sp. NBC_00452 TaxID=2975746 RepID=UPI002253814B|nr:IS3 family transposase [Streptomyces sp. NBC_00452]MCX5059131.1 IS3 family transposase [Streptomyces sp. NBC_00452]
MPGTRLAHSGNGRSSRRPRVASKGAYGVPRVHAELRRLGRTVNRKRVERVVRERGIVGVTRRRRRSLTRPDKQARPDLIGRDFTAARPGTLLGGDITYLPTQEGWLDLATREVIGYAIADHHRAESRAAPATSSATDPSAPSSNPLVVPQHTSLRAVP